MERCKQRLRTTVQNERVKGFFRKKYRECIPVRTGISFTSLCPRVQCPRWVLLDVGCSTSDVGANAQWHSGTAARDLYLPQ